MRWRRTLWRTLKKMAIRPSNASISDRRMRGSSLMTDTFSGTSRHALYLVLVLLIFAGLLFFHLALCCVNSNVPHLNQSLKRGG